MKVAYFMLFFMILIQPEVISQMKYHTSNGFAHFFSRAPLENIEASTNELKAVIDFNNGDMLFIVPVESFVFEKALMRRHFNDQYMESHKYPEARFNGKILDFIPILTYYHEPRTVRIKGTLAIHGVTREITETATLSYHQEQLIGEAVFRVNLEDYNIKIPRMLVKNIAENMEVTIKVKMDKARS